MHNLTLPNFKGAVLQFKSFKYSLMICLLAILPWTDYAEASMLAGRHGQIHYEYSAPQAQCPWQATTVLVHGFSTPMWAWDHVYDALSNTGCGVLRFDLHGRGQSQSAKVDTFATFFDQIDDLLATLQVTTPVNLVGWSMGGAIVSRYAQNWPAKVSRVVLVAPFSQKKEVWLINTPLWDWIMVGLVSRFEPEWGYKHNLANPEEFDHDWPKYAERFNQIKLTHGLAGSLLSSTRNIITHDQTKAYQWLGSSNIPVLLIWGQKDTVVPYGESEILRNAMPKARFAPIQDAGHAPQLERPNTFIPTLMDFLKLPEPD